MSFWKKQVGASSLVSLNLSPNQLPPEESEAISREEQAERHAATRKLLLRGFACCAIGFLSAIILLLFASATGAFQGGTSPMEPGAYARSSGLSQTKGALAVGCSAIVVACFYAGARLLWRAAKTFFSLE